MKRQTIQARREILTLRRGEVVVMNGIVVKASVPVTLTLVIPEGSRVMRGLERDCERSPRSS